MNTARTLVRSSLDHPVLLDRIGDEDDLSGAGVNSGELIRLALACEDHLGRALGDEELAGLTTVRAVAELIGELVPEEPADMWLAQLIQRGLDRRPDALALRDVRRDVTWTRLHRDVQALATRLRSGAAAGDGSGASTAGSGAAPGDRVLVVSGNRVEVLETYLACALAGLVAVPVNPALADPELLAVLDSVEPTVAVVEGAAAARLRAARPGLDLLDITTVEALPDAGSPLDAGASGQGDPVAILHTSATTGRAKGVVVDQRSLQVNALSWMADVRPEPETPFLNAGPLFHGSMVIALDHLAAGGTVCVLDRFTPQGCLAALETWRIEHAFLVPSMVRLLLDAKGLPDADLSALRLLLYGAAPMPEDLAREARTRLGADLQGIYGITEGGGPALSLRPDDPVGPPPVPGAVCLGTPMLGTRTRIVADDGREPGPGGIGELHLGGDGLMQGYWKNPDATSEVLRDGWLNTRDLCCTGADGRIWTVDRRNDLILRGGQNVYPAEIEHVLRRSPHVADVVVVPLPSEIWGQVPVAFVQPAEGCRFDALELLDLCVEGLAAYKRPGHFLPIDRVPRNPAGKALRVQLRELARELTTGTEHAA
ncbi:AMP-binding protein [Streptomyces sp. NPDC002138]|uniref:AMP-binding protein n=1 Tax=Streptomyces sp. NPDC002138 TaxID=3154410 RepID=UPI00331B693B